jgi:hypothetical protein
MKFLLPLTFSAALILLSACAAQTPPPTLQEKLAGKSPEERQEVLRLSCLNEADWQKNQAMRNKSGKVRSAYAHRYYPEVSQMKALCREMTTAYLDKE